MTKFGVRLIASYFILWGLLNLTTLSQGGPPPKGLISFGLPIDYYTAWIGVFFRFYIGTQLFRIQSSGRDWALFILWQAPFQWGLFMSFLLIQFFSSDPADAQKFPINFNGYRVAIDTPLLLLLIVAIAFLWCYVPLYYLLRKKTKIIFEKPIASEANPQPIISQDVPHAQ